MYCKKINYICRNWKLTLFVWKNCCWLPRCCLCAASREPRPRPANEQIKLTVTYSDESAETRELFYGKKGIIHRFMELTPEVKLEYARNSAKSSSTRSLNRQSCNSLRPGFPTYMEWQWNHRKVERVHITDYRWLNFVHEIGGFHG